MSEHPVLPAGPAWFAHRIAGHRHLGVLAPVAGAATWVDCGPADERALLASGGLTAPALDRLFADGSPMDSPPAFDVPVARPSKILCLGKNFAAHAAEFGGAVPDEPLFFTKLVDTLSPHGAPVRLPYWVESRVDHEAELAVVLGFPDPAGRGQRYVPIDRAGDLVAGYTVLDDITARTIQGADRDAKKPWLRSKSFDTFCPIGPWVAPPESFPGLAERAITLEVNGERRQHSTLGLMVVGIPEAISWLSAHTTLRPGDVIAMGTPAGVGPLLAGDRVAVRIDGLAELRHTVVREEPPTGGPWRRQGTG